MIVEKKIMILSQRRIGTNYNVILVCDLCSVYSSLLVPNRCSDMTAAARNNR